MIPWFPGEVEVPTEDYGSKFAPTKMIFLEIGFEMDEAGHLKIRYSHKGKKRDAPNQADLENEIRKYLIRFPGRRRNRNRPLSGDETPMSINGKKSRLVVLKLSESNNLQFNQQGSPISVEVGKADHFGGVFKIDNQATFIRSQDLMGEHPTPHCKHAIFAVDAITSTPLRFNIHLDLVEYDDDGDIAYTIPIIIDPDVRHPGGDDG